MNDYYDNESYDDDLHDPDEKDIEAADESMKFDDFVRVCPACKKPITEEMDSCPFCGDIIYRTLSDGTFSPRKGPLVKIVAVIIVFLVTLALIGMLLMTLPL